MGKYTFSWKLLTPFLVGGIVFVICFLATFIWELYNLEILIDIIGDSASDAWRIFAAVVVDGIIGVIAGGIAAGIAALCPRFCGVLKKLRS